ncbi:protein ROOT INITIATION DEFECTIVE 3-like [Momordica charantia]|uniref:Protein ROOT INITIATION DEFECTIVE 3-like n=1 Tax=Momordica charantia TaxID=3673 RepID=A0A6J1DBP1_MOMCH|nr:protein ROOT INITIATION DEFECTIVE 3-like [Momordica charantia]
MLIIGQLLAWVFDDGWQREAKHLYEHSFTQHNLPITDIVVVGFGGGSNAIIIFSSVDQTCKQQGSAATGVELERLKRDYGKSMKMLSTGEKCTTIYINFV